MEAAASGKVRDMASDAQLPKTANTTMTSLLIKSVEAIIEGCLGNDLWERKHPLMICVRTTRDVDMPYKEPSHTYMSEYMRKR